MRFFGASLWRFPSFLHARDETTGTATQRRMPSVLRLRTGVRIPPPPAFARVNNERASAWQARLRAPERACALRLGRPCNARSLSRRSPKGEGGPPAVFSCNHAFSIGIHSRFLL